MQQVSYERQHILKTFLHDFSVIIAAALSLKEKLIVKRHIRLLLVR